MAHLIYPPLNHETDSETIFLIGSFEEKFTVNGEAVEAVFAGNFCPVFDLNLGENVFDLNLDGEDIKLVVERLPKKDICEAYQFKDYTGELVSEKFKKICLDPGHGGIALGTRSPKAVCEKDLNLSLSKEIKKKLESVGFEVILTREDDRDLSLEDRVKISKDFEADLFLSIHHNAIPDHLNPIEHYGISAHYYYDHSQELALQLSEKLSSSLNIKNNSAIRQNLYVTRENQYSQSILLECGYLIHPEESERLLKSEFQVNLADNLASFLSKFLKNS